MILNGMRLEIDNVTGQVFLQDKVDKWYQLLPSWAVNGGFILSLCSEPTHLLAPPATPKRLTVDEMDDPESFFFLTRWSDSKPKRCDFRRTRTGRTGHSRRRRTGQRF